MDVDPSSDHHERCFGCGQANLFGLLLETDRADDGGLTGRWFVKQDHQGPATGTVHPGLLACALIEAALLAAGPGRALGAIECQVPASAARAVGTFCEISAALGPSSVSAVASIDGQAVARLTAPLAPAVVT
jgi:hypothetical protein